MTALYKKDGNEYYEWSSGSTVLLTEIEENGHKLIISIKCAFGENHEKYYALFDTGARWTIIPQSIADLYINCFSSLESSQTLSSRFGQHTGILHLCSLRILVDSGEDLLFETTVLVIPEWNYPIVIGFTSLLDKIRWACDPTIDKQGRLYFGLNA